MRLLGRVLSVLSDARRQVVFFARQIRADLFPVIAAITRSPERVAGEKQEFRIFRRKNYWFGPQHPEIFRFHRYRENVLRLTGASIEPRQFPANDDVRIERIGDDVTVLLSRDWLPVAERDLAFLTAALGSNRAAFLLPAVKPVRKRVVCADVIQLRRRLVIPRAPRCPAIHRDDRALIGAE